MSISTHVPAGAGELPRFQVSDYHPDGGVSAAGFGMLVSALVLIGAALGFVAHWVSQYFWLILLFPIGIGLILGFVGQRMVKSGRIRNPAVGGLAGFLGGALAMSLMHYFDYESFRKELAQVDPQLLQIAQLPPEQRQQLIRDDLAEQDRQALEALFEAAQVKTFFDYMEMEARHGVELKKTGRGQGLNLGYYGSYIYWIVEILIVAGITFGMVKNATSQPFCAACDQWKQSRVLGFFSGDPAAATRSIQAGDLNQMRAAGSTAELTNHRLSVAWCSSCGDEGTIHLKLEQITTDGKGNVTTRTVAHGTYPAVAMSALAALFAPQTAQPSVAQPTD
ncbi:hypothetical protein [Fontivita pretiosa]|uniref:hypothetical protein n=1 Tax=Fontivita pretiosa TaxID=2989684 RepID=UPI003D172C80